MSFELHSNEECFNSALALLSAWFADGEFDESEAFGPRLRYTFESLMDQGDSMSPKRVTGLLGGFNGVAATLVMWLSEETGLSHWEILTHLRIEEDEDVR